MPTYEYECQACGHAFEELQGMTEAKLKKCPKCHKNRLSRLIGSGSGMIFKGTGFYETDYKKKKKKPAPSNKKKDPPKPASKAPAPIGACGRPCSCHP